VIGYDRIEKEFASLLCRLSVLLRLTLSFGFTWRIVAVRCARDSFFDFFNKKRTTFTVFRGPYHNTELLSVDANPVTMEEWDYIIVLIGGCFLLVDQVLASC
jgi:hypothetical protein